MALMPFAAGGRKGRSIAVNSEDIVNLYPEVDDRGKSLMALHGCPGLRLWLDLNRGGTIRGAHVIEPNIWLIIGSGLFKIATDKTITQMQTLATAEGPVTMADDGLDILIGDGASGEVYDIAGDSISAPADYPSGALHVAYENGYFITFPPDSQQFFIAEDVDDWDATEFGVANRHPGSIQKIIAKDGEIWIFGSHHTEVWQNTGRAQFPYSRLDSVQLDIGTTAPWSVKRFGDGIAMLAEKKLGDQAGSKQVVLFQGYAPSPISNHSYDKELNDLATIVDGRGMVYRVDGHEFYQLTVGGKTRQTSFDSIGEWQKRETAGSSHLSDIHIYFNGDDLVTDPTRSRIYHLTMDEYTDDGKDITALITAQHMHSGNQTRVIHQSVEVIIESGVGAGRGHGVEPSVEMRMSNDGARTWSGWLASSIGKMGEYKTRVYWQRLGTSVDRAYQFRITSPVKRSIMAMAPIALEGR